MKMKPSFDVIRVRVGGWIGEQVFAGFSRGCVEAFVRCLSIHCRSPIRGIIPTPTEYKYALYIFDK